LQGLLADPFKKGVIRTFWEETISAEAFVVTRVVGGMGSIAARWLGGPLVGVVVQPPPMIRCLGAPDGQGVDIALGWRW